MMKKDKGPIHDLIARSPFKKIKVMGWKPFVFMEGHMASAIGCGL